MKHKKNKSWLIYLLTVIAAYLIIHPTSEKKLNNLAHNNQSANKVIPVTPEAFRETPSTRQPKHSNNTVQYKIKHDDKSQHAFDDNLCTADNIRANYKPEFTEAINRLSGDYQHYQFKLNQYIELHLYATSLSTYFKNHLIQSILYVHNNYRSMLGKSAERKIVLNLVITPQRSAYEYYTSFYSDNLTTSLGVYFAGMNIAFIDDQQTDNNALKTAIHESVHALHAHIIGKTPRMFNEGMAEFFENLTIDNGQANIAISAKRLSNNYLPLMQFFDHQQWKHLNKQDLYFSSWAWTVFMLTNENRKQSLITYMKQEQIEPCSAFSADDAYTLFRDEDNMFEIHFYEWLNSMKTGQ